MDCKMPPTRRVQKVKSKSTIFMAFSFLPLRFGTIMVKQSKIYSSSGQKSVSTMGLVACGTHDCIGYVIHKTAKAPIHFLLSLNGHSPIAPRSQRVFGSIEHDFVPEPESSV
jgi:hypothetical protein